jgi:DNA-binding CsgD family transcriptional regulator
VLKLAKVMSRGLAGKTVTPKTLQPLLDAAEHGEDLVPVMRSITQSLGFDSFLCGWASASRPDRDTLLYVFTTLPPEWAALYDRELYIEVDPRVQVAGEVSALFSWSADDYRGRSSEQDRFFDDAARFGIRSGACFGWRDFDGNGVMVAYNAARPRLDAAELREKADALYSLGYAFHNVFLRNVIEKDVPSRLRGAGLTRREVEALQFVARGLTLQDIAPKMHIAPRTVRYHVDSAVTKLGALKRDEAVALAVKGGLINLLP